MPPDVSGYQSVQDVRADPALKDVRVLMMTARGLAVERRKAVALGADGTGAAAGPAMLTRLSLRLRVLLIFAGLAVAVLGLLAVGLWVADRGLAARHADAGAILDQRLREMGVTPRLAADIAEADPDGGEGAEVRLSLTWTGAPVPMDRLEDRLSDPPDPAQPELTRHEILAAHASGIWLESEGDRVRLVLPLRLAPGGGEGGGADL